MDKKLVLKIKTLGRLHITDGENEFPQEKKRSVQVELLIVYLILNRNANITNQYYESESRLLTKYYQLDSQNLEYSLENLQIEYQKEDDLYMLEDKINDSQVLQLSFVQENDSLKIISLKTINLEE